MAERVQKSSIGLPRALTRPGEHGGVGNVDMPAGSASSNSRMLASPLRVAYSTTSLLATPASSLTTVSSPWLKVTRVSAAATAGSARAAAHTAAISGARLIGAASTGGW